MQCMKYLSLLPHLLPYKPTHIYTHPSFLLRCVCSRRILPPVALNPSFPTYCAFSTLSSVIFLFCHVIRYLQIKRNFIFKKFTWAPSFCQQSYLKESLTPLFPSPPQSFTIWLPSLPHPWSSDLDESGDPAEGVWRIVCGAWALAFSPLWLPAHQLPLQKPAGHWEANL